MPPPAAAEIPVYSGLNKIYELNRFGPSLLVNQSGQWSTIFMRKFTRSQDSVEGGSGYCWETMPNGFLAFLSLFLTLFSRDFV